MCLLLLVVPRDVDNSETIWEACKKRMFSLRGRACARRRCCAKMEGSYGTQTWRVCLAAS